jgi:hypothetical protein
MAEGETTQEQVMDNDDNGDKKQQHNNPTVHGRGRGKMLAPQQAIAAASHHPCKGNNQDPWRRRQWTPMTQQQGNEGKEETQQSNQGNGGEDGVQLQRHQK